MRWAVVGWVVLATAVTAAPVPKFKRGELDVIREKLLGDWQVTFISSAPPGGGRWEESYDFDGKMACRTVDTEQDKWWYRLAAVDGKVGLDLWVKDGKKLMVQTGIVKLTVDGELVWRRADERKLRGELPDPTDMPDRPTWDADAKTAKAFTEYRLKRNPER